MQRLCSRLLFAAGSFVSAAHAPAPPRGHWFPENGPLVSEVGGADSLFCFTSILPASYEPRLLEAHYAKGTGIFSCDEHLIFSNVSGSHLFRRDASPFHTSVIPGHLHTQRNTDGTYKNTHIFILVWGQVFADGRFRKYDWTIKLEVDTMVVPPVLRQVLARQTSTDPVYLRGSGKTLNGAIEVLSRAATEYFASHAEHCAASELAISAKTEAAYVSGCLDSLAIRVKTENSLLLAVDPGTSSPPCDSEHAAFHPLKSWTLMEVCEHQTGRNVLGATAKALPKDVVSIFCFMLLLPYSYEAVLVAAQYVEGVGLFGCDDYMLLSNVSAGELFGPGIHPTRWPHLGPSVAMITGNLDVPRKKEFSAPYNSKLFIRVWSEVFRDLRYLQHDWTLKLDPDTVFIPSNIRKLLLGVCPGEQGNCGPLYLTGLDGYKVHGPIEAISKDAMLQYVAGVDLCVKASQDSLSGEQEYLSSCLRLLRIPSVREPQLLSQHDYDRQANPTCDTRHAAFHPFKMWADYLGCLRQAGYYLIAETAEIAAWSIQEQSSYPSLLCWSVVRPSSSEPALLLKQKEHGMGVFTCDDHIIISNTTSRELFGKAVQVEVEVISTNFGLHRGRTYTTRLSSAGFVAAWDRIFEDGRYVKYDWTVKLDVDSVVVPQRLRELLYQHCQGDSCGPKYLSNFGKDLHGPVEAVNLDGMERYRRGADRCLQEVDRSSTAEDVYLSRCLDLLVVERVEELSLLSDWHDDHRSCDTQHAVFHPFTRWETYHACLCQTGYGSLVCGAMMASNQEAAQEDAKTEATTAVATTTQTATRTETATRTQTATTTETTTKPWILTTMAMAASPRQRIPEVEHYPPKPSTKPSTATHTLPSTSTRTTTISWAIVHVAGDREGETDTEKQDQEGEEEGEEEEPAEEQEKDNGQNIDHRSAEHSWLLKAIEYKGGIPFVVVVGWGGMVLAVAANLLWTRSRQQAQVRRLEAKMPLPLPGASGDPAEVRVPESVRSVIAGVSMEGFDSNCPHLPIIACGGT